MDFKAVFESIPGAFVVVSAAADATIAACSDDYSAATGLARDALAGRSLFDVPPWDSPACAVLRASLARVVATRAPDTMPPQTFPLARPSEPFPARAFRVVNTPVLDSQGAVQAIVQRLEDLSGVATAEISSAPSKTGIAGRDSAAQQVPIAPPAVASEADARSSAILDSITEGFFTLDRAWRFGFVNREALRILDRPVNDLTGKVLWEVYPGMENTEFERAYLHVMNDRETDSFTAYYPHQQRWYEVTAYPALEGIAVSFRNVTRQHAIEAERARLEAESERQRRIYETALSNTPDLVYIFGLDHRFLYANEALLKMWGLPREQALASNWQQLGYERWHSEMHDREIDQVIATGQPVRGEVPFNGTDGRRMYDYIFAPVFGPDGAVVAVTGTTRDVTDRQRTEQAIREQAQRLVEADRAKDEFIATLSHELRNPLTPLRNSLALLRQAGAPDARSARAYETMERQLSHLVRLVDDLLELSRVSRGELSLRTARVELAPIVRHAVETSEPLIEAARHHLTVSLPDQPITLTGDSVRLAQVISNLLNNAARYTPDGGAIAVDARRDGDAVVVRVADNGVGVAPDALERIFGMFSRGESVGARGEGGLGIGLALARRLAEMHGGTLAARSDGPGRGSEFTLRIPLAPAPTATPSVAPAPAPSPASRAALAGRTILVADDNVDAAESLGAYLEFLGAEVRLAHDGPAALGAFADFDPAVALLDVGMPGMDGHAVARAIRERFPARRAFLVALTGWGQEDDRRAALAAGFDRHMVKPPDLDALLALLVAAEPPRAE